MANQCWSMDSMSDRLFCGRRFRTFNVVNDFNREVLAIEAGLSLPALRVTRALDRIAARPGYPRSCEWTMARSLSWSPWQAGLRITALSWSSSSQESRHNTHTWNGSIAPHLSG
jgi:transposase InsO family protein